MKRKNMIFTLILILIIFTVLILCYFLNKRREPFIPFTRDGDYYVQEIPNFLSKEECERVRRLSESKLFTSKVYTSNSDLEDKTVRISDQCWLKDTDDEFISDLSKRIADITSTDIRSQEELQVVRYKPGGFYKPHYDACNKLTDDCTRLNKGLGPRFITFIIYLNDDFDGGETFFPEINKKVVPQQGKAAIFYDVDSEGEILPKSLHGGLDVSNGEKWICNKWIRLSSLADKSA